MARSSAALLPLLLVACDGGAEAHGFATGDRALPADSATRSTGADSRACPRKDGVERMTVGELRRIAREDGCALGSVSIGTPDDGALVNGVRIVDGAAWTVLYPANAWGTQETVDALERALTKWAAREQGKRLIRVGDVSSPWGGPLSPHRSHQSGRDVDIGYPRLDPGDRWWEPATAGTIDSAGTWALVRALVTESDVEVIFIDGSLQPMLRARAIEQGEESGWVRRLFEGGCHGRPALIRHEPEHLNHMHVRFYNPVAQRKGRAVHDIYGKGTALPPRVSTPLRCLPPRG